LSCGTTIAVAVLAVACALGGMSGQSAAQAPTQGGPGGEFDGILESVAPNSSLLVPVVPTEIVSLVGHWVGEAGEPGGTRFEVEFEVEPDCAMNRPCGWIAVPHVPCRGRLTLIDSRAEGFEFYVDEFDAASDRSICRPRAGEMLLARPDGAVSYAATYSGARGVLERTD
jgi:hypothetical protein